ncbi:MAG: hypothetical protein P8X89_23180 [Reinekea sp.]
MVKKVIKIKIGKQYHPQKKFSERDEDEIVGDYWRAWRENDKYFYEYDIGHFASKFTIAEISKNDFLMLRDGKVSHKYIEKNI